MKHVIFAALLLTTAMTAKAESVTVGDPAKGTPIASINQGKVQITSTGITVDRGDDGQDDATDAPQKSLLTGLEDILVPFMFFAFCLAVILGGKYLNSRNEERRLQLLRLMVEKGQPVPDQVMSQLLSPQMTTETETGRQTYKRTRNAYGFTMAGALLLAHALINQAWSNTAVLVPGLIFICLGLGGLAGIYLPRRGDEKTAI